MTNTAARLILANSSVFGSLPVTIRDEMVAIAKVRTFRRGDVLFSEGDVGDVLYGVIAGMLRIQATSMDGRSLNLNVLGAGEIFGEIAFLDGGLRTASCEVLETAQLLCIPRAQFLVLLGQQPEISLKLLELLCRRIRWTSQQVSEFVFLTPRERLARRLLHLAGSLLDEPEELLVQISQLELARYLGISRQVVNGYLRGWQESGLIELGRAQIRLLNTAELRAVIH